MKKVRVRVLSVKLLKNGDTAGYKGETLITALMPGVTTPGGQSAQGSISITNLASGSVFSITKLEKSFLFFADLSFSTQLIVGATFELKKRWIDRVALIALEKFPELAGKLFNIPDAVIKVISDKIKLGDAYFYALGIGRFDIPEYPETSTRVTIPLIADRDVNFTPWRDTGISFPGDDFKQVLITEKEPMGEIEIAIEVEA